MNAAATKAIEFDRLTKFYGRDVGVENVTFSVERGEVFGFLGPNGAGKTTTIRALLGLIKISNGSAFLLGQDVSRAGPAARKSVGYLPGALALYRNMNGHAYLNFISRLRGGHYQAEIESLAERLSLDLHRRIRDLSKGNRQKIGVIQAFMHSPEVLVLDEPTMGLDPIIQREFQNLVQEAAHSGAAVLLSSHVLSEVEHLAHQVAIINKGRLVIVEHVNELRERAVRRIDLHFDQPVPLEPFTRLTNVSSCTAHDGLISCTLIGAETELLRIAVDHDVVSVRTHEPSLDDVFLHLVAGGA